MTRAENRPAPAELAATESKTASSEAAFTAFYLEHEEAAFRYIDHSVAWKDAPEIVNAAFSAVWRRWERHGSPEEPRPYLFAALKSALVDHYRAKSRTQALSLDDGLLDVPDEREEGQYEAVELWQTVEGALGNLPHQQQRVMRLHLEGYSEGEIAHLLKISPKTVSVHLLRARRALKVALSDLGCR